MGELETLGAEQSQIGTFALRDNGVTRGAIVRLQLFTSGTLVFVVVTPEAAQPVLMAVVVRINRPVGFSLRENGGAEDRLHGGDRSGNLGGEDRVGVFRTEKVGDF